MAFWIFKYSPEKYRLEDRLRDPNPVITFTVNQLRDEIHSGDTVFLWETGRNRGVRAVLKVDDDPRDMPEFESEQKYWVERDDEVRCRIVGTLTHRFIDLGHEYLRDVPGLAGLSVFDRHVNQQATNFPVTPEEGTVLLRLLEREDSQSEHPEGIPGGISRDDIIQAVTDFDAGIAHGFGHSTTYDLVFQGKRYPPKAIVGLAARRIAGHILSPYDFKGGEESRCFRILRGLGFDVQLKPGVVEGVSFKVGQTYDRRGDIHERYGGQQQGGIATPTRAPHIFLFTGPSGEPHGYRDGWDDDGVFHYTGEGQSGDMEFIKGNLAIRDHAASGKDLHLFESLGKGKGYRYAGPFDCGGWEYGRAPDSSGQDRRVIVFHLIPEEHVAPVDDRAEAVQHEEKPPLDELRRRALAAVRPPGEQTARKSQRTYRERSAAVRDYVLARANGVCESCKVLAPFQRRDGTRYLEPHHTTRLADDGPDHPRYVGAVCPNCHREVHHGANGPEVNRRLQEYLASLEPDSDLPPH